MNGGTAWLPDLITLAECGGDWPAYCQTIYEIFCHDFVTSKPTYPGKRFALKRHPVQFGKEATFWHLIQEGPVEAERLPDFRRCERIRWPRPMIEALQTGSVRVWRNVRGNNDRILIAVDDFSYVVVLDERQDFVLLWTAYCVERQHQRRKFGKEFDDWQKTQPARNG